MKFEVEIKKETEGDISFLFATFTDTESKEQSALKSQELNGDRSNTLIREGNFWYQVELILWKKFDPENYPFIEKEGHLTVKPN